MSAAIIERAEPADAEARAKPQAAHTLDALNTVAISAAHLEAAMKVFAAMPESSRDPPTRRRALRQFARDADFADEERAGAALQARITALSNWIERHDPHGQSDTQAVYEAAARFPLSELAGGSGFEPPVSRRWSCSSKSCHGDAGVTNRLRRGGGYSRDVRLVDAGAG